MYKLDNFKTCCDYLGIDNTLPVCQIDERQIQATYKLRVCMNAWNKQDGFEPDEKANYHQEGVGYTPHFNYKDGRLFRCRDAYYGSITGIVLAYAYHAASLPYATFGLRICLGTRERAIEFGQVFIETFNELI